MEKRNLKKNLKKNDPDDWMYRPILKQNTRADYDGNQIESDWIE